MAEMILTETSNETITTENIVNNNNITTTSILDDDESILGPSHLEQDVWQSMVNTLVGSSVVIISIRIQVDHLNISWGVSAICLHVSYSRLV